MRTGLSNVNEPGTHADRLDSLRAVPAPAPAPAPAKPTSKVHEPSAAMERFLCEACGDVIGVYEPLVMRTTESERATSRAAEPKLRARDGAYFHRGCRDVAAS